MTRLMIFLCVMILGIGIAHADSSIQAYIDGRSHLVIQSNNVWWHHYDHAAPGRHNGADEPIILNGVEWYPEWPEEGENRNCDCDSSKYEEFFPPLLADGSPIELEIVSARGDVFIVQQPSETNDYTAIVEFNDNPQGGPDWYDVVISYSVQPPDNRIKNDLVIDFGASFGIYTYLNNNNWESLRSLSAEGMVTGDLDGSDQDEIVIDFGDMIGFWIRVNNISWEKLHDLSLESMVTGDLDANGLDEVIIDFGPDYGIWLWLNNTYWVELHTLSSESMVTGDIDGNGQDDVVIDFGPGVGTWLRMNNSSWVKLHPFSPESMVTGDLDDNGQDEVILDFGSGIGILARMNNTSWAKLHSVSPESMVAGDKDGNGQDEVIVDFGDTYGLWVHMNSSHWVKLHSLSAQNMVTGNIDGLSSPTMADSATISSPLPKIQLVELSTFEAQ